MRALDVLDGGRLIERALPHSEAALTALFAIEVTVFFAISLRESLSFDAFFFGDQGANLTIRYLVNHGLRPGVDFGYHYGLLAIVIGKLWFWIVGHTPVAYQAAMLVTDLLMAWAMARLAVALDLGVSGIALLIAALPFAIQPTYCNFAHAAEAILLCHALAFQAQRKRNIALALVATACLVKPEMAYLYGFLLLVIIIVQERRHGLSFSNLCGSLAPAVLICALLLTFLVGIFGLKPVAATLLPGAGMQAYRAAHYGFFSAGKSFWYMPGATAGFYLGRPVVLFLLGSIFLAIASTMALASIRNPAPNDISAARELLLCCAIMQLLFIFFMYGSSGSWTYYPYILLIGLAALDRWSPSLRPCVWILVLFALLGNYDECRTAYRTWKEEVPVQGVGLWGPAQEVAEWSRIRVLCAGRRDVVINSDGGVDVISRSFGAPTSLYLFPNLTKKKEEQRLIRQIERANAVVGPTVPYYDYRRALQSFPDLSKVLESRFSLKWRGTYFQFFTRNGSVQSVSYKQTDLP